MADISRPNDPATKIESTVDDQDATQKNDAELQFRLKTTVEGPGTPATKGKTGEESKESRERMKTVFIVLAFIVSCLALVLSCLSYSISKRSAAAAERSATAAENSAVNSGKTADAAQKNVATAQAALKATIARERLDQRAWVGVTGVVLPQFEGGKHPVYLKDGQQTIFEILLDNSGKTPAKNIYHQISFTTLSASEPFSPHYPTKPRRIGVIQPGSKPSWLTPPTEKASESEIEPYRNGSKVLYVFGKIMYDDVFGIGHYTTFCVYLLKDLSIFTDCETYNDAN